MEEILRTLVSFPTITGHSQPAHELIEYVANFVRHRGMHIERYMSGGFESIVATTRPHDKTPTVLLAAHGDVVAAPDELFTMRHEDGKYFGRGVLDMKCALAAYLQVVDDLKDNIHDYNFGIAVSTDEEVGGTNGVKKLLEEGYRPKVCIIPDGGDNWQVQISAKGLYIFEISAYGTSVHSSRHWEGVNAFNALRPVFAEVEKLFGEQGPESNSLSFNIIKAGGSLSQVPDKATITMDVRTINGTEHVRIRQEVENICRKLGLELVIQTDSSPVYFDHTDRYIAPYISLIEQTIGTKVTGTNTLGTNDARFFAPLGIPCISFYPTGGNHHSSNEWVSTEAVEHMYAITKKYIETIAGNNH